MFKKNRAVSLSSQVFMANRQGLFLSLLLLLMGLAQLACGSSGGGNNSPTAPTAVTYSTNPAVYTEDVAIAANIPTVTGGAVTSFAVAPALPAGLSLNAATGVITGTPSAVSGAASYQVTASNAAGSARVTLSIAVTAAPVAPTITTQPQANQTVAAGASVSFTVVATGTEPLGYRWRKGGVAISGATSATYSIPSAVVGDSGTYTVTVSNGTEPDAVSQNAVLTVTPASPLPVISYPSSPCTFFVGTAIAAVNPSNSGGAASSWGITPALPAGLAFSTSTGVITGTPTAAGSAANFTVTASNAAGSGQAILSITVWTQDNSYGTITASRTTGVGPLSVHFSVEYPAGADPAVWFHQYEYSWNFGDPASGSWNTTGLSRNKAKGAITAHVFENPGQYTISLTVRDAGAVVASSEASVTVSDPATVFSGTHTVCVSDTADFIGAPAGSLHVTTTDLATITKYATAGKRVLFRRGATWSTPDISLTWPNNAGQVLIGAFGSGSLPVITVTSGAFLNLTDKRDWRIMDLDLRDPTGQFGPFGGVSNMQRILIYRVRTRGFADAVGWGHWNDSELFTIDQMAVVDCDLADAQVNVVYVGSERLSLMGNRIQNANESHVTRVWQAYKSVISHNIMSGSSLTTTDGRHALKLHGPGPDETFDAVPDSPYLKNITEFCIVSDNLVGSSGPWPITIGPADSGQGALVSHVIFERNRVISEYGAQSSTPVQLSLLASGRFFTIRNNLFDGTKASTGYTAVSVSPRGVEPAPIGVHVYNNTIFRADNATGNGRIGITVDSASRDVYVKNNLVSFPGASGATMTLSMLEAPAGTTVAAGNLMAPAALFVDPGATDPLLRNFRLQAGSPGVDQGVSVPVQEDFDGLLRPMGMLDVGAYER